MPDSIHRLQEILEKDPAVIFMRTGTCALPTATQLGTALRRKTAARDWNGNTNWAEA
jgi:hypothetical protein